MNVYSINMSIFAEATEREGGYDALTGALLALPKAYDGAEIGLDEAGYFIQIQGAPDRINLGSNFNEFMFALGRLL